MEPDVLNAAYGCMADADRRMVLIELYENGPAIHIERDHDDRRYVAFLHNHLPKLADSGFIRYEFSKDGIDIERGTEFDQLIPILESAKERVDA